MKIMEPTQNVARRSPKAAAPAASVQLLLIEDNPDLTAVLHAVLGLEEDLLLRSAGSVAEAVRDLAGHPADLILLDLGLPDSAGLDTLDAMQQAAPGIPIVILSGVDDEEVARKAVRRGAQDYLLKTEIGTRALVRALGYALERHAFQELQREHAAELARRDAEVEAELKFAGEIQRARLPLQPWSFPATAAPQEAALRFAFHSQPAEMLGANFFSVQEISAAGVGVFICDVLGHRIAAALVSATVRGLVEKMPAGAADPGRFLGELNRALHAIFHRTASRVPVTAFYMVVNIERGEVRYANAGHPAPFFIRPSSRQVRSLASAPLGAALGLSDSAQYPASVWRLDPGDRIILFTKSIYEIEGPFSEPYGRDRLPNDIRKRIKMTPPHLLDDLVAHIRDFSLSRKFTDDVCLLGMEVCTGAGVRNGQ